MRAGNRSLWLGALVVALASFGLGVPWSLARWPISEDAVEYLAIAQSWVEGAGFVNPIMLSFALDGAVPPLPGFATRAPLLPGLLALPIALGASLALLGWLHQAASALVAAAYTRAAGRLMSAPAAVAAALTLAASVGWVPLSGTLVTELYALGVLLLVVATARAAFGSSRGALLAAGVAVLAWLTRPNLVLAVPIVLAAALLELGARESLRSRPLWIYLLAALGSVSAISLLHQLSTGLAPYAQYRVLLLSLSYEDFARYRGALGALEFAHTNWAGVRAAVGANLASLGALLLTAERYPPVGWLALPALVYAFRSRERGRFERRLLALASVILLLPVAVVYGPSDPGRYAFPAIACLWLLEVGMLDAGLRRLRSLRARASRTGRLLSPAALVVGLLLIVGGPGLTRRADLLSPLWSSYRERGVITRLNSFDPVARSLCGSLESGAVVAAGPSPWSLFFWCGNPAMWTPRDLDSVEALDAFLDEHQPRQLLLAHPTQSALGERSARLRRIERRGGWVLYRYAEGRRLEHSPPPLHHLGASAEAR